MVWNKRGYFKPLYKALPFGALFLLPLVTYGGLLIYEQMGYITPNYIFFSTV